MDYKSLLHRYIWHVFQEEGANHIPDKYSTSDVAFSQEECEELSRMDGEEPA